MQRRTIFQPNLPPVIEPPFTITDHLMLDEDDQGDDYLGEDQYADQDEATDVDDDAAGQLAQEVGEAAMEPPIRTTTSAVPVVPPTPASSPQMQMMPFSPMMPQQFITPMSPMYPAPPPSMYTLPPMYPAPPIMAPQFRHYQHQQQMQGPLVMPVDPRVARTGNGPQRQATPYPDFSA